MIDSQLKIVFAICLSQIYDILFFLWLLGGGQSLN